ncbi:Uncharacterized protein DAT39_011962 [Clarias magur]|uniref:Uncharacterized protein n=1 Tax=Clarias magur TaxID=1594786 RepID=A0A8J4X9L0_CLAMG|nr:Uncharacterized protein DAT39_011962 [Clarias magur]
MRLRGEDQKRDSAVRLSFGARRIARRCRLTFSSNSRKSRPNGSGPKYTQVISNAQISQHRPV